MDDLEKDFLLAEHDFVVSLIPLYRRFQMQLVRFGILIYTAILAVLVTMAEGVDPDEDLPRVFHAMIAVSPYPIALLLLAFATTEMRIKRASSWVREVLSPRLTCLVNRRVLTWEEGPGDTLNPEEKLLTTSGPLILVLALPALAGSVWSVFMTSAEVVPLPWALGGIGALLGAFVLAATISWREFRTAAKRCEGRRATYPGQSKWLGITATGVIVLFLVLHLVTGIEGWNPGSLGSSIREHLAWSDPASLPFFLGGAGVLLLTASLMISPLEKTRPVLLVLAGIGFIVSGFLPSAESLRVGAEGYSSEVKAMILTYMGYSIFLIGSGFVLTGVFDRESDWESAVGLTRLLSWLMLLMLPLAVAAVVVGKWEVLRTAHLAVVAAFLGFVGWKLWQKGAISEVDA